MDTASSRLQSLSHTESNTYENVCKSKWVVCFFHQRDRRRLSTSQLSDLHVRTLLINFNCRCYWTCIWKKRLMDMVFFIMTVIVFISSFLNTNKFLTNFVQNK
jgi:hypothetical protein